MKSYIVSGLGFGDEGKGSIVDFIGHTQRVSNNIRFNGGNQAAHHVVRDGILHCFSQFGSAMFEPNMKSILSKYTLIDPYSIKSESDVLISKNIDDPLLRLYIDNDCPVITPIHKFVNRIRELINSKGSCGCGVGETIDDRQRYSDNTTLKACDLHDIDKVSKKFDLLLQYKLDWIDQISEYVDKDDISEYVSLLKNFDSEKVSNDYFDFCENVFIGNVNKFFSESSVYEGAQGTLLDMNYGFMPYITKTNSTCRNAIELCRTSYDKIGVMRVYMTRHGDGPLPTYDENLTKLIPIDDNNIYNKWQGHFRIGWPDMVLMRYAVKCNEPDYIAMTNIDRLNKISKIKICNAYLYTGDGGWIDDCFEYEYIKGSYILTDIKQVDYIDLKLKINHILSNCKPIYDTMDWDSDKYMNYIEDNLILK